MGIIAPWYLKEFQLDIYSMLMLQRFPVVEKSRRIGGTTTGLVYVQEKLRRKPQWICRWAEPWKYQAREIVMPEMDRLQESCPTKHKFKYYKTDSFYELPSNGSRIYLRGVNEDKGESARGPFSHIIMADEFGSWREASYIKNDIFLAQLLSTNGQMIINTSPPKDLNHPYYTEERETAVVDGRFIQKIITDSIGQLYTLEQVEEMCRAVGGPESVSWRREFLCEAIADPELLIVPEFLDTLEGNVVPDDYPRPEFFTPYVGGDSGADDNTALLFGWYDFVKAELVVEREMVTKGKTTKDIIDAAKKIEAELWPEHPPRKRVYDAPKQLIYDIFKDHKWPVHVPQKDDRIAAIHEFRVEVGARRFKIKESCALTRRQLKVGMWKDDRHLDFERSEGLGHLDAVAAAIYLNRCIDRSYNPIPHDHGASRYTHHIDPALAISRGTTEDRLARLVGGRTMRRR